MAELRRDGIVGRWVVVNTDDSFNPDDFTKEQHLFKQEATCQFCYHRENQTPPEIEAIRPKDTEPNTAGWSMRVIPNKFPVLKIEGELEKRGLGIFDMSNGIGAHEVLIETPNHRLDLADLSVDEVNNVIGKYISRFKSLSGDDRFRYILIFRNFGDSAGASLEHPHSQIIALPMVPQYVLEKLEGAKAYRQYRGRCVFCDMIRQEYEDKERIITQNDNFISFCPYAPRYPFESWVIPKEHCMHFSDMSDEERKNLALILKEVLMRNRLCLSNPSYNFYIHTAPVNDDIGDDFHWHIEIIPKLTNIYGFEWATDFYAVATSPRKAAEYLRAINIDQL